MAHTKELTSERVNVGTKVLATMRPYYRGASLHGASTKMAVGEVIKVNQKSFIVKVAEDKFRVDNTGYVDHPEWKQWELTPYTEAARLEVEQRIENERLAREAEKARRDEARKQAEAKWKADLKKFMAACPDVRERMAEGRQELPDGSRLYSVLLPALSPRPDETTPFKYAIVRISKVRPWGLPAEGDASIEAHATWCHGASGSFPSYSGTQANEGQSEEELVIAQLVHIALSWS